MPTYLRYLPLFLCVLAFTACERKTTDRQSLAGEWAFSTDVNDLGIEQGWYDRQLTDHLTDRITLPGSMAENKKGEEVSVDTYWTGSMWNDSLWYTSPKYAEYRQPGNVKPSFWLTPERVYYGPAWYSREIDIPYDWKDRRVFLRLERPHWETTVWLDGKQIGEENFLATPHVYDLGESVGPGTHTLTLRVDNRVKDIDVGVDAHSVSDNTQTNWNGVVGNIELLARPAVYLEEVRIRPDVAGKRAQVRLVINNTTGAKQQVDLSLTAAGINFSSQPQPLTRQVTVGGRDTVLLDYPMGDTPALWDEFSPNVYRLTVELNSPLGKDRQQETFGMRDFRATGTRFTINERPVFLRGTLECAIFPLTGYPPTNPEAWADIFATIKAHGLNHMRFHSWCPPEAAFTAADEAGIYLQVEASAWATIGDGEPIDAWLYKEGENILRAYGNHPSFVMMAYGNEPSGDNHKAYLADYVRHFQQLDSSRVHAPASGWPYLADADFYVTAKPRIQHWAEGLNSLINSQPPQTTFDYQEQVDATPMPIVAHEIGQWCVYPNFREMSKYTGVLQPRNFEIFRETLERNGMASLADSFLLASGKLQTLCYKADIEAAQRTQGFAGFQLLDLHDFPGQGTALVGVLDAFWEEKGYVTPEAFSAFCGPTTPLARFPQRIYYASDSLVVPVEIAHFGAYVLDGVSPTWTITDPDGATFASGTLPATRVPIGNGYGLGTITADLQSVDVATRLNLRLTVGNASNDWNFWVYPDKLPTSDTEDILLTRRLDPRTLRHLESGGSAILQIGRTELDSLAGSSIELGFSSIFWNTSWTKGQSPHTLGILCNPAHPALGDFPTDYHSDWQWWEPLHGSAAIVLDGLDPDIKPIVRIIDDWFENRRTALLFEVRVGGGKLIVSGVDLETDLEHRPVVRQLRYSLEQYMRSPGFTPQVEEGIAALVTLFK